ncbi:unnamed protein product, partial [Owenia fusiformis]
MFVLATMMFLVGIPPALPQTPFPTPFPTPGPSEQTTQQTTDFTTSFTTTQATFKHTFPNSGSVLLGNCENACPQDGIFCAVDDSSAYYWCIYGQKYENERCPDGQIFNPLYKLCDDPDFVTTNCSCPDYHYEQPVTFNLCQNPCPYDGRFCEPFSPHAYYQCLAGVKLPTEYCPYFLVFNSDKGICDFEAPGCRCNETDGTPATDSSLKVAKPVSQVKIADSVVDPLVRKRIAKLEEERPLKRKERIEERHDFRDNVFDILRPLFGDDQTTTPTQSQDTNIVSADKFRTPEIAHEYYLEKAKKLYFEEHGIVDPDTVATKEIAPDKLHPYYLKVRQLSEQKKQDSINAMQENAIKEENKKKIIKDMMVEREATLKSIPIDMHDKYIELQRELVTHRLEEVENTDQSPRAVRQQYIEKLQLRIENLLKEYTTTSFEEPLRENTGQTTKNPTTVVDPIASLKRQQFAQREILYAVKNANGQRIRGLNQETVEADITESKVYQHSTNVVKVSTTEHAIQRRDTTTESTTAITANPNVHPKQSEFLTTSATSGISALPPGWFKCGPTLCFNPNLAVTDRNTQAISVNNINAQKLYTNKTPRDTTIKVMTENTTNAGLPVDRKITTIESAVTTRTARPKAATTEQITTTEQASTTEKTSTTEQSTTT